MWHIFGNYQSIYLFYKKDDADVTRNKKGDEMRQTEKR